jgi:hypothetical protein
MHVFWSESDLILFHFFVFLFKADLGDLKLNLSQICLLTECYLVKTM